MKKLVAYFSRKGNNYAGSGIVNLEVGNTEVLAKKIQKLTGSDIFEIKTLESYPEDYTEATVAAKKEQRENARPQLAGKVDDFGSYGVIFIGYPNWWGTMPMAVCSFLESYDFAGKTVMPFCTHEGSGMGSSESDIKKLCPNATVLAGLAIRGSSVKSAQEDVSKWLRKLGMTQ